MTRVWMLAIGVTLILLLYAGTSQATLTNYTITEVSCGGAYANPEGISTPVAGNPQWIAGQWVIKSVGSLAFYAPVTYPSGVPTIGTCQQVSGFPGGSTTAVAYGISDLDVIVGYYVDSSNNNHGFIRDYPSGTISQFNIITSGRTIPRGMNTRGYVVGNVGNEAHGFAATTTYSNPSYAISSSTLVDISGATGVSVNGINNGLSVDSSFNDAAIFVGHYNASRQTHGFWGTLSFDNNGLITNYQLHAFDCSGAAGATKPQAINDNGMVVGTATINNVSGGFTTTWDPNAHAPSTSCSGPYVIGKGQNSTSFVGVNGGGQIVGFPNVLLTPPP